MFGWHLEVCVQDFFETFCLLKCDIFIVSGEIMNRLECGLFQITQDLRRCNLDGFQLLTGLYNLGKWEQNHTSFVYSFSLCICTFIGESCATCVSKYKQSYSVCCSITSSLVSLLSRLLLGSCYAKGFFLQRSVWNLGILPFVKWTSAK